MFWATCIPYLRLHLLVNELHGGVLLCDAPYVRGHDCHICSEVCSNFSASEMMRSIVVYFGHMASSLEITLTILYMFISHLLALMLGRSLFFFKMIFLSKFFLKVYHFFKEKFKTLRPFTKNFRLSFI